MAPPKLGLRVRGSWKPELPRTVLLLRLIVVARLKMPAPKALPNTSLPATVLLVRLSVSASVKMPTPKPTPNTVLPETVLLFRVNVLSLL